MIPAKNSSGKRGVRATRGFEVREAGESEVFFKLDRFDPRIGTFRPTKGNHASEASARESALKSPGRYRVVACEGRKAIEGVPFEI